MKFSRWLLEIWLILACFGVVAWSELLLLDAFSNKITKQESAK